MERYKNGTIFGDTERPMKQIKELYPQAKYVPVCALGCYYTVYSDDTYSTKIAEFNYVTLSDRIPHEAIKEFRPFGSYFKILWFNN